MALVGGTLLSSHFMLLRNSVRLVSKISRSISICAFYTVVAKAVMHPILDIAATKILAHRVRWRYVIRAETIKVLLNCFIICL